MNISPETALYQAINNIAQVTADDLANGSDINDLIRNTTEELGEFCGAVAIEDGHKDKPLPEPSVWEAIDAIICSMSLFYARGGNNELLVKGINTKLAKWANRVKKKCQENNNESIDT
jgi:hypothetical protein